ncbi:hypothetical protein SSS_01920, partial [Sarcoptes scabiei]
RLSFFFRINIRILLSKKKNSFRFTIKIRLNQYSVDEVAIEILRQKQIECDLRVGLDETKLIKIIPEYDALIVRSSTQVNKNIIEAGTSLKLIGRAGVGVDNIDLDAAPMPVSL